jgi:hypothetical protein
VNLNSWVSAGAESSCKLVDFFTRGLSADVESLCNLGFADVLV